MSKISEVTILRQEISNKYVFKLVYFTFNTIMDPSFRRGHGKFLFPRNSKLATPHSARRFNQQYASENIQIQLISIYAGRFYLLTHITKLMLLNYKHVYK